MLMVGYTIDDLSFGMPDGDFVDDGRWFLPPWRARRYWTSVGLPCYWDRRSRAI